MRVMEYFPALRAGMGAYAESLVSSLTTSGGTCDHVFVVTGDVPWSDPKRLDRLRATVPIAELRTEPPRTSALRKLYALHLRPYSDVLRFVREIRPDVLHVHFGLYLTDWMLPLAVNRFCPVVLTVHDPVPHRWLLPRTLRSIDRMALRWRYSRFDHFIVHTAAGRQTLTTRYGVPANDVHVIPHGSDTPQLQHLRTYGRAKVFAVLGGLRRNKRVVDVIAAFQQLPTSVRREWRLRVAGVPESPGYAEAIRRQVFLDADGIDVELRELGDAEFDLELSSAAFVILAYRDFTSASGLLLRAMASGTVPLVSLAASLTEQAPSALRELSIDSCSSLDASLLKAISIYATPKYVALQSDIVDQSRRYDWPAVAKAHWMAFRAVGQAARDRRV